MEMVCIEEMVPKDHLLRKTDLAIGFTHLYDLVGDMYCKNNGRPSADPVVIFKMMLIQHHSAYPHLRNEKKQ